jgi:hypothetical protein
VAAEAEPAVARAPRGQRPKPAGWGSTTEAQRERPMTSVVAAAPAAVASGRVAGAPPPKPTDWGTRTKGQKRHWQKRHGQWRGTPGTYTSQNSEPTAAEPTQALPNRRSTFLARREPLLVSPVGVAFSQRVKGVNCPGLSPFASPPLPSLVMEEERL